MGKRRPWGSVACQVLELAGCGDGIAIMWLFYIAASDVDRDTAGGEFGGFFYAGEVDLGGADVGVTGEFADLMHRGTVADRVIGNRLVQRHAVVIKTAAWVSGVKEQVIEGKTPEITLVQTRGPSRSDRVRIFLLGS